MLYYVFDRYLCHPTSVHDTLHIASRSGFCKWNCKIFVGNISLNSLRILAKAINQIAVMPPPSVYTMLTTPTQTHCI